MCMQYNWKNLNPKMCSSSCMDLRAPKIRANYTCKLLLSSNICYLEDLDSGMNVDSIF